MKRIMINKTYDLKQIKEQLKNSLPFFYLLSVFVAGLIFAVIYYIKIQVGDNTVITLIASTENFKNLVQYFIIGNFLFSLVFFINGFSMLGKPFTFVLLFVYGFLLGIILIATYFHQKQENLHFFFLFFILPSVFYCIAQLSACVQSVFFSSDLYYNYFKNTVIKTKIRTYLKRYALILFLICSGGVVMSIVAVIAV
ncbi:MAG: stage II sporulation protein M [Clostridia bacterium]|nr:stage II sporulation protein M [Clostridia bacterium]